MEVGSVVGPCWPESGRGIEVLDPTTMPAEPLATVRQWVQFIQNTRSDFNCKNYSKVHVCSGHFRINQFDSSEAMQFRIGLRTNAPTPMAGEFPCIKIAAANPLAKIPRVTPSIPATCTTATITTTTTSVTTTSTTSTSNTIASLSTSPSTSSSSSWSAPYNFDPDIPWSPEANDEPKTKQRRRSILTRKKEVSAIEELYDSNEAASQAIPINYMATSENDKRVQSTPKMVHRKLQAKPVMHSIRIQVKPKTFKRSTGSQTDQQRIMVLPTGGELVNAATQTDTINDHGKEDDQPTNLDISPAEEEEPDDPEDVTWEPEEEDRYSSDDELEEIVPEDNPMDAVKYLVFESCLLELFKSCIKCRGPCVVEKFRPKNFGSQLKVVATCELCLHERVWYTQPMVGHFYAGNIALSAAILYSGGSATKVLKVLAHMNCAAISGSTYISHQKAYLLPAIVYTWRGHQRHLMETLRSSTTPLVVGGDGRADSPGHSAKYGSYSLMDLNTSKIIELQLVQSNETTSSNAMELEGLKRTFTRLVSVEGLTIDTIVTDRHASVAKWLREKHPLVKHKFDAWHIAKGVSKKVKAVSRLKDCQDAGLWRRSIVNHIYWCAATTPDGSPDVILAKYTAILRHMRNIHTGHGHELYDKCEHALLDPPRVWLKSDTKVYDKLEHVLTPKRMLNAIKMISSGKQTSSLESYHSVLLYFCPKLLSFSYQGMKCRLYLSALHWNENAGRPQARTADGTLRYKVFNPKGKEGGYTVARILVAPTYGYVDELMSRTVALFKAGKSNETLEELHSKPPLNANFENPDKEEAIRKYDEHRRFAKD